MHHHKNLLKQTILLLALSCAVATAADNPPSDASIRELLSIMEVRKTVDNMMPQVFAMMQNTVREATKGEPVPPEGQKMIDKMMADTQAAIQDELAWAKLEPLYTRV